MLAARYPRSNRAGCAAVELAQMSTGDVREQYLKKAIDQHSDAWFENGAQVGPLAMTLLAMHYAGLDRLPEAEKLAAGSCCAIQALSSRRAHRSMNFLPL